MTLPGSANEVPLALAFGAGLVASINPCGFALLPSLLFYYLGSTPSGGSRAARIADGLVVGLVLTAGFMLVFGSAGILMGLGARAIVRVVPWVTVVVGAALMALGGWLLAGKRLGIALPGLQARQGPGYRSLFLFGTAYAVGSLSCTLPVFLLVVGSALATGSLIGTVGVFLAYGLGMATVLMVLCLGTAGFRELVVRKIRRLFPHLGRISGALLLVGGGYVIYYWISLLSGAEESGPVRLLQRLQEWAQRVVLGVGERSWFFLGAVLAGAALLTLAVRLVRRSRDGGDDVEAGGVEEQVHARAGEERS